MLRGQIAWTFFYIHHRAGVFVFGGRWYLSDLVLCSRGRLAFLHVERSGLWDGLRNCNELVAFTFTCSFITVSFFNCILRGLFGPQYFCSGPGGSVGGYLVGYVQWWYFLL